MLICTICAKHEVEAAKASVNGRVFMASGIRAESKEMLMRVIDHMHGNAYSAARSAEKLEGQWRDNSEKHPWIPVLKKAATGVTKTLLEVAVAVYNDSLHETLSAWSWPARSLAAQHEQRVWSAVSENGWDTELTPTEPSPAALHYRDPDVYREMLSIVAGLERQKMGAKIASSVVYNVQVDCSVDRQQRDNKLVTARVIGDDAEL